MAHLARLKMQPSRALIRPRPRRDRASLPAPKHFVGDRARRAAYPDMASGILWTLYTKFATLRVSLPGDSARRVSRSQETPA